MIKSKKGAEYTTTTIIVIVLALIVLVILAMGLGVGWSNLWSKITGFFSPVNVDSVKQACQYACTTQSVNAYCCQVREVRFEKGVEPKKMTCDSGTIELGLDSCDINCDVKKICSALLCPGKLYLSKNQCDGIDSGKLSPEGQIIQNDAETVCCKKSKSIKILTPT